MAHIPSRDITGVCEGECRNLVGEADVKRQKEIQSVAYSNEEGSPSVSRAHSRNEAPGFLGGHV
ncbi:MAG TPA: hypothetical protein DHV36_22565 [Desulfobacteraceae bacterium]|nr:hypothetical protein [Desulfobacteraceae bacterium]|tara:strand:- start:1784 stop:1975 length:192 start_codon:yes stop_codon:yes gene_type:complete